MENGKWEEEERFSSQTPMLLKNQCFFIEILTNHSNNAEAP